MRKVWLTVRMTLGGAVCFGFLGTLGCTLLGTLYGAIAGDVSTGLNGALLGGAFFALAGAIYGAALGPPDDLLRPSPTPRAPPDRSPGDRHPVSEPEWPASPNGVRCGTGPFEVLNPGT